MSNQGKQYYIYLRSVRERIPCTRKEFDDYYHDINLFRQRQQYRGLCVCPRKKWLDCDMDCQTCPFYRNSTLSLDYAVSDDTGKERAMVDAVADPQAVVDGGIEEKMLLQALRDLLNTLTPDERNICAAIMDNLSERAAAAALGLPRNTYVYRRDKVLRRLRDSLKNFI